MIAHQSWPIDPAALWPFLIAVALVEITPGPNMAWLIATAMGEGRAAAFRAVAGVTAGLTAYMLAAVVGVAGAVTAIPMLYGALQLAGVGYLFWIAFETWRGAGETSPGALASDPFQRGLLVNLLNPKAAMFYIALLPGFIAPDHGAFARQALILGSLHIAVSVVVHSALVLAAAHVATGLTGARQRRLRRILAVSIAFVALWLFWETRQ